MNVSVINEQELNDADAGSLRMMYRRAAKENQILRDRLDAMQDRSGQVVGRIEHYLEGEPVRVVLTAAGLSLPDGALLYERPDHITGDGKKVASDMTWDLVGIDSEGGSHD